MNSQSVLPYFSTGLRNLTSTCTATFENIVPCIAQQLQQWIWWESLTLATTECCSCGYSVATFSGTEILSPYSLERFTKASFTTLW